MHLSAPWRIFRSPTCHVIYEYYRCRTNPLEDRPRELHRPERFVHWLSMLRHFVIYRPSPFRGAPPVDLAYESQGCERVTTSIARSHLRSSSVWQCQQTRAECAHACSHVPMLAHFNVRTSARCWRALQARVPVSCVSVYSAHVPAPSTNRC